MGNIRPSALFVDAKISERVARRVLGGLCVLVWDGWEKSWKREDAAKISGFFFSRAERVRYTLREWNQFVGKNGNKGEMFEFLTKRKR